MISRRLVLVLAASTALALAGCSSGGSAPNTSTTTPAKTAAEPSTAPTPTTTPAGRVVTVGSAGPSGSKPQGIVYSATAGVVAVAVEKPDRLLLLDPTTLTVRRSVSLPGSARHLQLSTDDRTVLVPAESAQELVEVSLSTGSTRATKVLRQPHDAAQAGNGDFAVADEFGKALSVVRDGTVVHTFADLVQPGGVAADGTVVSVVDVGAYTVSTYDLATLTRTARLPAGAGPTHVVELGDHRILVVDTRGGAVLTYSDDPLRRLGSLTLPGGPYGVATDPSTHTVWVTLTARNEVVGLDVSSDTPRVIARYPTVQQPDTVAVAPGSRTLWITGSLTGQVQRISR